jgi:hypothetical protein
MFRPPLLVTPFPRAYGCFVKAILKGYIWYSIASCLGPACFSEAAEHNQIRAARSVHLSYAAPEGLLFYNEACVDSSVNGSYFMACGWNTGYFGIQQLGASSEKVVLFSVWDPTKGDNPDAINQDDRVEVLFQAEDARIKRFGGEGTGAQCMWNFNWRVGETNRFLVGVRINGTRTEYTAWLGPAHAWKKLASFRTRTGGQALRGYYSFIEDFRRDGKSAQQERRARFGNGWVKTIHGAWEPLIQAHFTASSAEWESKENIDAGTRDDFFYLATGGDIKKTRELHSLIALPNRTNTSNPADSLPIEASKY